MEDKIDGYDILSMALFILAGGGGGGVGGEGRAFNFNMILNRRTRRLTNFTRVRLVTNS